ncbi:AI-2E family transporter [Pleurocapsales cyanobacterium LEGE 06147]|nr:AI-2E family transporter [Pleurocapsales cyanobacterium LEGE 06147]
MNFGTWIGFVVFFISLYVLWQIRQLLLLLFTAVVLANSLNILVKRFQKSGIKRIQAVLLALLLLLFALIVFFWLLVPPFVTQFEQLALLVPQGIERLQVWLDLLFNRLDPELIELLPDTQEITKQLQPLLNQLLGGGLTFFYGTLGVLLSILLLLVLSIMLLADPLPYRQGFIRLFPAFYRRRVDEILVLCDRALQGWLVGILFNMSVITVLSFVGLSVLRIPLALAQAMLAGIFTFIPNIGPALSVIPPVAIALIDAPWKSIAVVILYIVIQQLESNLLTPLVMAQQVSLLPAVTLLAQVFFATLFGFLGLFLALPLTVVGQVVLKEVLIKDILDQWGSSSETEARQSEIAEERSIALLEKENESVSSESQLEQQE